MARGGWLRHQHRTHTLIHLAAYFGVAFLLYIALKKLAPVLTPVMAAAFAWLLLAEPLAPLQVAGGLVVLFGIYLARRGSV